MVPEAMWPIDFMIEIMISYALMLYLGLAHVASQSSMKIHSPAHVEILGGA